MHNLEAFNFSAKQVRVSSINGEAWFVAKDVCSCLELKNVTKAISSIDIEDRVITDGKDTLGRNYRQELVNESGLYSLIFKSEKAEAKKFKRWVTKEVLPSLRKNGSYSIADWHNKRSEGKVVRKEFTDVIKFELIPLAISQGSANSKRLYQVYSKMIRDLLFIFEKKTGRDSYNFRQLATIEVAEDVVLRFIRELVREKVYYKDIYKKTKFQIEQYANIVGKTPVIAQENRKLKLIS